MRDGVPELVSLLAQLASASGSALYEPLYGSQTLSRRAIAGSYPPDLEHLEYADLDHLKLRLPWATLPLYSDGLISSVLILVFPSEKAKLEAKDVLRRIAPLFENLAKFVSTQARQVKLASRISELETAIAAEKILERARGVLREHPQLNDSTIDLVDRHISNVLASSAFNHVLEERLRELQTRSLERDYLTRAKQRLQHKLGLGEEKAYLHIRAVSRQRRKKMADIAREIVEAVC
jgi:hypothetical protein